MRARVLLVGCAVLAVLGCGAASASAAPAEEAPVEAVAVAEMEMPSVAFLSSGLWTHDAAAAAAPAETDAALLEAGHIPDDGRHGLATNGALTAHYATLRLDNTWARSHKYCASVGGALCTYAQICPRGKGHSAIGHKEIPFNRRSWAPVADKENMWVNMVPGPHGGKADRCATASDPAWGRTKKTLKAINKEWENHSKSLVACCDAGGVMKSFFRAGAKFPGSGSAEDDKAGSAADRRRRETRALDDLEKNHGADDESPMQTLINRGRISVSTSYASNHNERFLALNAAHVPGNSNAWCAKVLDQNQWVEADLGRPRRILSVSTQGRGDHAQWVTKYRLQYRNKKSQSWKRVGRTSFTGNSDQNSVVKHKLRKEHITARYVRLIPEAWHGHLSMRMDIGFTSKHTDGAKERAKDERDAKLDEIENNAVQNVAMTQLIARGQVKVSTSYASNHNERFCALNAAVIPGNSNAWCAKTLDQNQWIEADLARPRRILGVSTQGRGDAAQWVTSYRISYRDTRQQPWKAVPRTFTANQDSQTVVRQSLRGLNIKARFVRLQPLAWHGHLSMRWDVQYTSELTDGAAEKAFDAAELKLDEVEGAAHEEVAMVKLIERGRVAVSTSYASNHNERFCALNAAVIPGNSNAWCSRALDQNQWIQADLERPRRILGVATQGRGDAAQWVTGYRLQYRNAHGEPWKRVQRSFTGNQDSNTVVRHSLRGDYITARFIRLQPLTWHGHLSMRWDVDFTSAHTDGPAERAADARAAKMDEVESAEMQKVAMVKLLARGRVKVSTSYASNHNERFCALNAAHIPGNSNAWCAKVLDQNQWLEVDLDRPRLLLGVSTQGRGDAAQWCTAYRLSYRNNEEEGWKTIGREFTGNQDSNTVVRHSLRGDEITARYVRLQPRSWNGHLSMRWDIQSTSAHTDGAAQHKADAMEQKMDQLESGTRSSVAMVQLINRGAVSVSTSYASNHNERFCALNAAHIPGNSNAWCARTLDQNQWIQADLGRPRLLLGIATQGRGDAAQWVTQYRISYKSGPEDSWTTIDRDFSANQDSQTVVRHSLRGDRITARYVRLQPLSWHGHLSMRWDVDSTSAHTDGAAEKAADAKNARLDAIDARTQGETKMVSLLQRNRVRVSTNYDANHDYRNCALNSPHRGGFSNAWCAKTLDQNQWIEADLGSPKRIFGIATQGRGDAAQWVTAYRVQYRDSHGAQWKSVQHNREFTGNQDSQTVVRHSLRNDEITARFVRLQPTGWHGHLSMRWDIDYAKV